MRCAVGGGLGAVCAVALGVVAIGVMIAAPPSPRAVASYQPFSADSPFRTQIPDTAAVDANSAAMISAVSDSGLTANLVEFGIPIYQAGPDTPRYAVECTKNWGKCPFDGQQVPIPDGARPHAGSDGAMVVVDESSRQVFEFWQAHRSDGRWTVSWAGVTNLDGSGWGGGATGAGASRLGGVIRVDEIEQGVIPHALVVASDNVCEGGFRAPATKTDGESTRSNCIPEGTRIRLDPTVDLGALELAPAVRTVARALQVYGAYVIDRSGAPLSVSFELDPTAGGGIGEVYQQAGLRWDYDNMPGVTWDRLQVLA